MWLGEDVEISVSRIGFTEFGFTITDFVTDLPLNITGMKVRFAVAQSAGGTSILSFPEIEPSDPINGGFDLSFDGADFSSIDGQQELVELYYNGLLVDGDKEYMFIRGPLNLYPGN